MEVVPIPVLSQNNSLNLPFNRRNVEEWSRFDRRTGFKETAKIETDSWTASTFNSAHKYGKRVDSRQLNNVDGSVQQTQRKEMEIFQSQVPGGSMQVVRTQTVTSSSSSRRSELLFDDLELPINFLDLSSEKMKVNVGRSGSIGSRRPPSRPRSFIEKTKIFDDYNKSNHLEKLFDKSININGEDDEDSKVTIEEVIEEPTHTSLVRQKSCSSENINKNEENSINRTSKVRRSLQIPKSNLVYDKRKELEDLDCSNISLKERAAKIESLLRDGRSWAGPKENITVSSIKKNAEAKREEQTVTETKSYLFGDKRINGTGSLESRTNTNKTDEWHNRRKSYGFEAMDKEENILKTSQIESSTDSGICRSSEVISSVPSWVKLVEQRNKVNQTKTEEVKNDFSKNWSSLKDVIKPVPGTITISVKNRYPGASDESNEVAWNRKSPLPIQKDYIRENLKTSLKSAKNPWISQLSGTKLAEKIWGGDEDDWETDEKKQEEQDSEEKTTEDEEQAQKKKKVEFSKTEVHFAAESGRLNIVETAGKPPSNNILKRRRRSARNVLLSETKDSNLPLLHFGETQEQKTKHDKISAKIEAELEELSKLVVEAIPRIDARENEELIFKNATILPKLPETEEIHHKSDVFDRNKPRSILKNQRKSYLLGELEEDSAPIWKSTVVLHSNNFLTKPENKVYSSDGEAEFQSCLRKIKTSGIDSFSNVTQLKRKSIPDENLLRTTDEQVDQRPLLSVAERVKQVEELKTKTYSTKIHFGSDETRVLKEDIPSENSAKIWLQEPKKVATKPVEPARNGKVWVPFVPTSDESKTRSDVLRSTYKKETLSDRLKSSLEESSKNRQTVRDTFASTRLTNGFSDKNVGNNHIVIRLPTTGNNNNTNRTTNEYPKSVTLVRNASDVMKPSKPVVEMISRFDSLSKTDRDRRKTLPVDFKTKPREYTQADLEEELKNFTEDLDKDFKDIYEEEIESLRTKSRLSESKQNLHIDQCINKLENSKQFSCGYDSEDSDIVADLEVRSYMSACHDDSSDSEEERKIYTSWDKKLTFENLTKQIKNVNINVVSKKEASTAPAKSYTSITSLGITPKAEIPRKPSHQNVASISLRYEDDPLFTKTYEDNFRPRASFLNCPSLSEKYSKLLHCVPEARRAHSDDTASEQAISTRRFSDASLDRFSDITPNRNLSRRSYPSPGYQLYIPDKNLSQSRKKLSMIKAKIENSWSDLNGSMDTLQSSEDDRRLHPTDLSLSTITEGRYTTSYNKNLNSSASSIDSVISKPVKVLSKPKTNGMMKTREERLSQRASNREAQLQRSSSEDISSVEVTNGKRYRKIKSSSSNDGSRRVKTERRPSIKEETVVKPVERKSELKKPTRLQRTRSSETKSTKSTTKTEVSSSKGSIQKYDIEPPRRMKSAAKIGQATKMVNSLDKSQTASIKQVAPTRVPSKQRSVLSEVSSKVKQTTSKAPFNRFTR